VESRVIGDPEQGSHVENDHRGRNSHGTTVTGKFDQLGKPVGDHRETHTKTPTAIPRRGLADTEDRKEDQASSNDVPFKPRLETKDDGQLHREDGEASRAMISECTAAP